MPNIIVCMKIIIDPEMPFSIFSIDKENKKPIPPSGMPPVFSPFDENALEAALRMKDQQDCKVTIRQPRSLQHGAGIGQCNKKDRGIQSHLYRPSGSGLGRGAGGGRHRGTA